MAWRVASCDGPPSKLQKDKWEESVKMAFSMIHSACLMRRALILEILSGRQRLSSVVDMIVPHLTPEEDASGRVSFERGCQIVTGLKKKRDAVARFRNVAARDILLGVTPQTLKKFEADGFSIFHMPPIKRAFLRLSKTVLRKPYQRSGKYAKN